VICKKQEKEVLSELISTAHRKLIYFKAYNIKIVLLLSTGQGELSKKAADKVECNSLKSKIRMSSNLKEKRIYTHNGIQANCAHAPTESC